MSIKGIQHQASGSEDPKEYCLRALGMSVLPVEPQGGAPLENPGQ